MKDIPHFFLISFVCVILIYKTIKRLFSKEDVHLLVNEDIKFFSDNDVKYCIELLRKNPPTSAEIKENKLKTFGKKIYKWDDNFKFSSRILNAHVVAFVALYYFFIDWLYYGIIWINSLIGSQTDELSNFFSFFLILNKYLTL